MKVIINMFNILCMLSLIMGMLDKEFLEDVLPSKSMKIKIFLVGLILCNFITHDYISVALTFLLFLVTWLEKFRDFLCHDSESKMRRQQMVFIIVISCCAVWSFCMNIVNMVTGIWWLLKTAVKAVI